MARDALGTRLCWYTKRAAGILVFFLFHCAVHFLCLILPLILRRIVGTALRFLRLLLGCVDCVEEGLSTAIRVVDPLPPPIEFAVADGCQANIIFGWPLGFRPGAIVYAHSPPSPHPASTQAPRSGEKQSRRRRRRRSANPSTPQEGTGTIGPSAAAPVVGAADLAREGMTEAAAQHVVGADRNVEHAQHGVAATADLWHCELELETEQDALISGLVLRSAGTTPPPAAIAAVTSSGAGTPVELKAAGAGPAGRSASPLDMSEGEELGAASDAAALRSEPTFDASSPASKASPLARHISIDTTPRQVAVVARTASGLGYPARSDDHDTDRSPTCRGLDNDVHPDVGQGASLAANDVQECALQAQDTDSVDSGHLDRGPDAMESPSAGRPHLHDDEAASKHDQLPSQPPAAEACCITIDPEERPLVSQASHEGSRDGSQGDGVPQVSSLGNFFDPAIIGDEGIGGARPDDGSGDVEESRDGFGFSSGFFARLGRKSPGIRAPSDDGRSTTATQRSDDDGEEAGGSVLAFLRQAGRRLSERARHRWETASDDGAPSSGGSSSSKAQNTAAERRRYERKKNAAYRPSDSPSVGSSLGSGSGHFERPGPELSRTGETKRANGSDVEVGVRQSSRPLPFNDEDDPFNWKAQYERYAMQKAARREERHRKRHGWWYRRHPEQRGPAPSTSGSSRSSSAPTSREQNTQHAPRLQCDEKEHHRQHRRRSEGSRGRRASDGADGPLQYATLATQLEDINRSLRAKEKGRSGREKDQQGHRKHDVMNHHEARRRHSDGRIAAQEARIRTWDRERADAACSVSTRGQKHTDESASHEDGRRGEHNSVSAGGVATPAATPTAAATAPPPVFAHQDDETKVAPSRDVATQGIERKESLITSPPNTSRSSSNSSHSSSSTGPRSYVSTESQCSSSRSAVMDNEDLFLSDDGLSDDGTDGTDGSGVVEPQPMTESVRRHVQWVDPRLTPAQGPALAPDDGAGHQDTHVLDVPHDEEVAAQGFGFQAAEAPSQPQERPRPQERDIGVPGLRRRRPRQFTESPDGVAPSPLAPTAQRRYQRPQTVVGLASGFDAPRYPSHIATVVANFKPIAYVTYEREVVPGHNGCDIAIDWALPDANGALLYSDADYGPTAAAAGSTGAGTGFTHVHAKGPASLFGGAGAMLSLHWRRTDTEKAPFGEAFQERPDDADNAAAGRREHGRHGCLGLMVIIPGTASNSRSAYIQSAVRAALNHSFAVAVVHSRGFGCPLTEPRLFSGNFTKDLRALSYSVFTKEAVQQRFGMALPAVLVGFSLGGGIVTRFLAEEGSAVTTKTAFSAAAGVQTPWVCLETVVHLAQPVGLSLYHPEFCAGLKEMLRNNETVLVDPDTGDARDFSWAQAQAMRTCIDWDKHVMVPHHGYKNLLDYYRHSDAFSCLSKVRVPFLCCSAADDPVCGAPPSLEQWQRVAAENPFIFYATFPAGGHLGFLDGPFRTARGRPNLIERFFCGALAHHCAHATAHAKRR